MNKVIMRDAVNNEDDYIIDKLVEYNLSKVPSTQENDFIWINKVLENEDGEIIGGILSKMYCWNCLYIDSLWVNENYRSNGFASKLLKVVETTAKEKHCNLIHLDTFDFQAKDFYLKHGYEIFGVLDECPKKHKRYFLKKTL